MRHRYAEITYTETVKRAQQRYGARELAARREIRTGGEEPLGSRERDFITARDSFYMATVSESGWPYVQHRGGRPGFLQVLGPKTLGFADFQGNRQYLSVGNLVHDDRVALILLDYPNRRRLKLLGHARIVEPAEIPESLASGLRGHGESVMVERAVLIEVEAFDWNCAQHITPRYTEKEMEPLLQSLTGRIATLEALLHEAGIQVPENPEPITSKRKEKQE